MRYWYRLEHPFSRGSTHIQSADQDVYPGIDPRYLSHPFDLAVLSKIALHLQVITQTPPLSTLLVNNGTSYQPGYYELNENNAGNGLRRICRVNITLLERVP
jgi:hypothetical protein